MKLKIWFALNRVRVIAATIGVVAITGGLGTAAIINRAAGGVTLEPGPELDAAIEEAEQSLDSNYKQVDNPDPTTPAEPTLSTKYEPVKTTPAPSANSSPKPQTGHVGSSDYDPADRYKGYISFNSYYDMETYYMGQCPQDPEKTSGYSLSPLLALGLRSTGLIEDAPTWQRKIELEWGSMKQSFVTGWFKKGEHHTLPLLAVENYGIDMGGKNGKWSTDAGFANWSGVSYILDWDTLSISAKEDHDYHEPYSDTKWAEINALAAQMTTYVRDLDARFNAKCGEYPL